ncbi:DNA alkylation repair protein [Fibrella forsythiae]|uniref:DNA alkylation repair protein n=1 Tax=Fibrella forsythiae TaxID=2817061 RepID=A0ABS3JKF1_9BACT|nr:DNA alkylation repair protein [Fibrella forsythiae]MBO0950465.1 DNA alkylation repair protein [Fibrella forsythiae]
MTYADFRTAIIALEQPERAQFVSAYFKTHPGQYGEGDVFLGLTMPQQRELARSFVSLPLAETEKLLHDAYHECRMTGLLIWTLQAKKNGSMARQTIADRYVANRRYVNNWDLVDCSCPTLLGLPLLTGDRSLLYDLADEDHLWSQRIAIVTTWQFIRQNQFGDTFALAEKLFSHKHDLIHKAIGWMLREIGKRDRMALDEFLHDHIRELPRTALRYAIERHEPAERQHFMTL